MFNLFEMKPKIKLTGTVKNPGEDGWQGLTREEQLECGLINENGEYLGGDCGK